MRRTALLVVPLIAALAASTGTAAAKPGELDRRYGTNGAFETKTIDGGFVAQRDGRGRVLVGGGVFDAGVVRLTRRGNRDRSFGSQGVARIRRPAVHGIPFGLRRLRDRTIRTGTLTVSERGPVMALLRYGARGGRLAPVVHEPYMPGPMEAGVLRPDGGAYIASDQEIRAIAPDGNVDPSFGFGGTVRLADLGAGDVASMLLRSRGRLLVATQIAGRTAVLQLTPDGRLDPSFGEAGVARVPHFAVAMHTTRGGDLLLAGGSERYFSRVTRLSGNGTRRRSFGTRGVAGTARGRYGGYPADVAHDARGRIYVLFNRYAGPRTGVFALTQAGRPLRRFGRRGLALLPKARGELSAHEGADLVVDRGGLLAVGSHHVDGYYHSAFGDGSREDISAYETRLIVWRLDR